MDLLHDILRDVKYEEIRELAAGNPATDSSIPPPNGSSPWNLLSRELRDEVYRHAYGRRSGWLKILFKAEINLYNKLARSTWKKGAKRCKLIRFEHYINRFLVSKEWASEAARALFSTTRIRFDSRISRSFLPHTCLGIAHIRTISLDMRDLPHFVKQLPTVCPQLRRLRLSATYCGACSMFSDGTSSEWTEDMVRNSSWLKSIRPLCGLQETSLDFTIAGPYDNYSYYLSGREHVRKNMVLVQSMFRQSATRPLEASPPLPVGNPLRGSVEDFTGTTDANQHLVVRCQSSASLFVLFVTIR